MGLFLANFKNTEIAGSITNNVITFTCSGGISTSKARKNTQNFNLIAYIELESWERSQF